MHRIITLTLITALFMLTGCGIFAEDQPPFTAAELDRLLSHLDIIFETGQAAEQSYNGMNLKEQDEIVLAAKNDMIQKLGWDLHRFYYIKKNCNDMVSLHFRRLGIERIEREIRKAPTQEKRQNATKLLEHRKKELATLMAKIDQSMTMAERVLIDERLPVLWRHYEKYVPGFKWNEG